VVSGRQLNADPLGGELSLRTGVLLLAISAAGFVCGDRRPVVINSLSQQILVSSVFEDGRVVQGHLPPSGRLFLSDPPHYPTAVTISVPGGQSQTFTGANAPDLLGHKITGGVVGWRVTESGIIALSDEDLASE